MRLLRILLLEGVSIVKSTKFSLIDPKSLSEAAESARLLYNNELQLTKQRYRDEIFNNPEIKEKKRLKVEKNALKDKNDYYNPLIVGVGLYKKRRDVRKALVENFGKLPQIPPLIELIEKQKIQKDIFLEKKKKLEVETPDLTAENDLKTVFFHDLHPDNPRLYHLLNLWHESEHFITARNIDYYLDRFFEGTEFSPEGNNTNTITNKAASLINDEFGIYSITGNERLKNIVEHGVIESHNIDSPESIESFGTVDCSFRVGGDSEIPSLEMGNVTQHMLTRETVVKDVMNGSLVGRPGVIQMMNLAESFTNKLSLTIQTKNNDNIIT